MWIGINFVFTFTVADISWQAHLGGFLGGSPIAAVLVFAPRGPRRAPVQLAGTAAIAASSWSRRSWPASSRSSEWPACGITPM